MNGGVSLAVWIGGVAHEINRAIRCDDAYGDLLDLTATAARVDVISGASAGGINGALLALALAYNTELGLVRDVWLERGSLDGLLRSPYDTNASSLLRGNDRFLDDLRDAFARVRGTRRIRPAIEVPLELTLTATMLRGEPNRITDDLGAIIDDVTHRARFEFCRGERFAIDPFAQQDVAERLALAARASASFPVAFEPVFCPINVESPLNDSRFLNMASVVPALKQSRFLVDGGVLDNKPLEGALRSIFRQRATREVRRVLAYVVPTPGHTAVERADEFGAPPTLGEVALAALIELPRVESISAQLESIIEHNRSVRRKRDTRGAFVRELKADGIRDLAMHMFAVYRKRRLESAADYIVQELSTCLATANKPLTIGRRKREWLTRVLLASPEIPWVPEAPPVERTTFDDKAIDQWAWGAITVEHIAEILFELFRRALMVVPLRESGDPQLRERLKRHYSAAYDLLAAVPQTRRIDREYWASRVESLERAMAAESHRLASAAADWARESVNGWLQLKSPLRIGPGPRHYAARSFPGGEVPINQALGWIASTMASLIAAAAADVRQAAELGAREGRTEADRQLAADLRAYIDYLAPASGAGAAAPALVLARLLTLEIVQYATGTYKEVPDQFVELVQFSAQGRSPLGGAGTAAKKLAGAQLGNFGGFYKKAWRANDWMFGRMDGADRLIRVLLNPARLARLYANRKGEVLDLLHRIAVPPTADAATRAYLERRWNSNGADLEAELDFLENPDIPVPEQIPQAAEAIIARLHLAILRDELPELAGAAIDDRRSGASERGASARFIAAAEREIGAGGRSAWTDLDPSALVGLFGKCQIGEERFADELTTDLFATTLTRSMAVATTIAAGSGTGFGAIGRVFQSVRVPMLIIDALAQNAVTKSRASAFASGVAIAVGGLIVALYLLTDARLPGSLVSLGTLVFVASVALSLWRHPRLTMIWVGTAAVAALLLNVWPEIRQLLRSAVAAALARVSG